MELFVLIIILCPILTFLWFFTKVNGNMNDKRKRAISSRSTKH